MADLGAGLFAWIKTVDAITALIGAGDACQFYPVAVQSGKTPPLIVYEEEKDQTYQVQDVEPSVASSIVSFSCIDVDTTGAEALAAALYAALKSFFTVGGLMGEVTVQRLIYHGSSPACEYEEQQFAVDVQVKFWFSI